MADVRICDSCAGRGEVTILRGDLEDSDGRYDEVPCPECHGDGFVPAEESGVRKLRTQAQRLTRSTIGQSPAMKAAVQAIEEQLTKRNAPRGPRRTK